MKDNDTPSKTIKLTVAMKFSKTSTIKFIPQFKTTDQAKGKFKGCAIIVTLVTKRINPAQLPSTVQVIFTSRCF